MSHKILGQGSFGCVIKPALKCNTQKKDSVYKNKVSKVMYEKHAKEELKEMKFLTSLKGIDKYAVSIPIHCKPELNDNFNKIVNKCTYPSYDVIYYFRKNKSKLSQLLLEDGGLNLDQAYGILFQSEKLNHYEVECFYTSLLNLFDGLIFFNENKVVHFDIKLINLVYNFDTGIAKFIDFGLMQTHNKIKTEYSTNKAKYARNHFNWPPENAGALKIRFEKEDFTKKYRDYFSNYDEFLEKFVNTFDSWGLCVALLDIFMGAIVKDMKNMKFLTDTINLIINYAAPNITKRESDLKKLKNEYNRLLNKYKIYKVKQVKKTTPEIIDAVNIQKSKNIDDAILKQKCDKLNKDYNPLTKRCLKKCEKGFERNDKFKCVKIKKPVIDENILNNSPDINLKNVINNKKPINNSLKKRIECFKQNKDYNPKTKRCNKLCNKGEIRNKDFKCVTIKNKKNRSLNLNERKSKKLKVRKTF